MNTIIEQTLEKDFGSSQSAIARDLRLNLKRILLESALSPEEGALSLTALASTLENNSLAEMGEKILQSLHISEAEIQEAKESTAIMGMLNTYYKFKTMLDKSEEYKNANLRMTIFSKPNLGKERFEMLAFAISVLNGCQSCIQAHEDALKKLSFSTEKIHDLARLAAVAKGIHYLK